MIDNRAKKDLITVTQRKKQKLDDEVVLKISTTRAVCLYIFFGTFVADIIFLLAILVVELDVKHLGSLDYYILPAIVSLLSYPVALIYGGIPALLSGALINASDENKGRYLRAGLIGFIVSLLFYAMFFDGFNKQSISFALLGATAAVVTRFRIHCIETKDHKK